MFLIALILFAYPSLSDGKSFSEDEIVAVSVIFRHGQRSILVPYPNDPYKNASLWAVPFGELTNEGKLQHYSIGKWLRQRYNNFLNSKYFPEECYALSSDYDRCLMSAAANLAGLYPPEEDQVWNPLLNWQPIPIHALPFSSDGMIALTEPCPEFKRLFELSFETEYILELNKKNKNLFAYLTSESGLKVDNIEMVCGLFDMLVTESLNNFTLPEWANKVFPEKMEPLTVEYYKLETSQPEMAKLRIGQLFNEILEQFDSYVYGNASHPKFKMFSAHDNTVFNILHAFRIPNLRYVPFAATVLLEVRKNENLGYYTQLLYKTSEEAQLMTISECTEKCEYNKFMEILKPLSLNQEKWREACKLKKGNQLIQFS